MTAKKTAKPKKVAKAKAPTTSEGLYRTLVESTLDGIVIHAGGQVAFANRAAAAMLGLAGPDALVGQPLASFVHPDDLASVQDRVRRVQAGETVAYPVEVRYVKPDGAELPVENTGALVTYEGKPAILAVIRDITARKWAEAALQGERDRAQRYLDVAGAILVGVAPDGTITLINRAGCALFGYSQEELIGRDWIDLAIPERERDGFRRAMFARSVSGDEPPPGSTERSVVTKSGEERLVSWHTVLLRSAAGDIVGTLSSGQDITEHKRAEEELQTKKLQLSNALEMAHLGHWEYDVATDLFTFNDHFYKIFRTTVEQIGGYTMHSADYAHRFVHPDDMDVVGEETRKAIETTDPDFNRQIEHRMLYADGTVGHITVRIFIVQDSHGRTVKTYGVNQDITERKLAEEALRESEKKYQCLFDNAQVALFRTRISDSRLIEINRRYADMAGYSSVEDCMAEFNPAGSWADPDGRSNMLRVLQEEGSVNDYETEIVRRDGTHIWILFSATIFPEQGVLEGSIVDITDRKRAEETLRESERHLKEAQRVGHLGSWDLNVVTGDLQWSDECYSIYGFRPQEFVPTYEKFRSIVHPEDLGFVQEQVDAALNGDRHYDADFRFVRPNGETGWIHCNGEVTRDAEGKPLRLFGTQIDITERKRAEEEKAGLEAQLQQAQKIESVGRLAGGVAHDFNNMLGVILGHAEIALAQVDPALPLHAHLEEIHKAAGRSADLTRQLLAFARKQMIAPKVLDLNETVEGMLKMLRRLIGEDIQLAWQPEANLWPVRVDPSQIDQILANLCVNARDSITDVGKMTIETANSVFDADYCALHAGFVPGEYVRLAVSDDGCGMDKETLAQVFEPFFTTKGVGAGTGLGLATVYGIVKQNDGFINAYSEPGQGTTFAIYLPRHAGKAEQARTEDAAEPLVLGHETILLVEDEPAILEMTKEMLELHGYVVVAAGTPGEAIRMAREHVGEIHLLMTDVVMPEMNGRNLARNLLSVYPHLKRLFTSGYSADLIAHRGVLDDGVHFLQKPFSMKGLAAKVREALESN